MRPDDRQYIRGVLAAAACVDDEGNRRHDWPDIGAHYGKSRHTVRVRYYRYQEKMVPAERCPLCAAAGVPELPKLEPGERHRVEFDVEGNYAEAKATSDRIRRLEQLLEAADVDLDTWKIRDDNSWGVKKWDLGAKAKHGHLEWDDGKIVAGYLDYDGLETVDLWSVWATFVRRHPEPVRPLVQPVECPVTYKPQPENALRAEGVALVGADGHFGYEWKPPAWRLVPFHDRRVLDIFVQIAAWLNPDVVELLGDFEDLTVWTDKYARSPEHYGTTQPAIFELHWWLRRLREASPRSQARLHMGNHEARMDRAMVTHMRDACELKAADALELPPAMSVPGLLALDALGVEWVPGYPDDICWLGEGVQTFHGHVARSANLSTVSALLKQATVHQVTGHVHRDELVSSSFVRPDGTMGQVTAYCPGCMCHIDGRVPGSSVKKNWRQGIGVVEWAGESMSVHHIPVHEGRAVFRGREFVGDEERWLDGLRADLPGWNW